MASSLASSSSMTTGSKSAKSKAAKAPRNALTLKQKHDVLEKLEKSPGMSSRELAEQFSCGKTQITNILKNQGAIIELYESNMSSSYKLLGKRCRQSDYAPI